MTNSDENKKKTPANKATTEKDITPPPIDVGEAADPFERLQTKKVPLVQ